MSKEGRSRAVEGGRGRRRVERSRQQPEGCKIARRPRLSRQTLDNPESMYFVPRRAPSLCIRKRRTRLFGIVYTTDATEIDMMPVER